MIKFQLDIKPLSVNQCWQGRRFFTDKGKKFRELCLLLMPRIKTIRGLVKIRITVGIKRAWLSSDVDNFLKPLLDALVKREIIEDDRFITDLRITKHKADKNYVEIQIKKGGALTSPFSSIRK